MIHRLPTNYREKLLHLWARLHTDATINEVTPLNRGKLCETVVCLHRKRRLTVLMNDPQTADELPTKYYYIFRARLHTEATIKNKLKFCNKYIYAGCRLYCFQLLSEHVVSNYRYDTLLSFSVLDLGRNTSHKY